MVIFVMHNGHFDRKNQSFWSKIVVILVIIHPYPEPSGKSTRI